MDNQDRNVDQFGKANRAVRGLVFGKLDMTCLLYTSDAADDMQCVDLGGRRII